MRTLIISDLHLGNGGEYDAFAGGDALPAFLDREAAAPTHVLVNGDGVDFLMNEDPLVLDAERAVAQARAIVAAPPSAAVLQAFGRVIARGGDVTIRLGNHDIELALPEVQAVLRGALGLPAEAAAKLRFEQGDAPGIIDVGGARILVTHGEHCDSWNRVDYDRLGKVKGYKYSAGSTLVKQIMNPITREHGLRFVNLLKPDFQGGALTALAVAPAIAKMVFKQASIDIAWQLFKKAGMGVSFAENTDPVLPEAFNDGSLDVWVESFAEAGLDDAERSAMEAALGDDAGSFADEDDPVLSKARLKLARVSLKLYARMQRHLSGQSGHRHFSLDPDEAEWKDATRLAKKFGAAAVIIGHTHAARWREAEGVVFANTGTWIWMMQLPAFEAGDDVWADFIAELRKNPKLLPEKQQHARTFQRFTAVLAEPHADGGAAVSLVEWDGRESRTLGSSRVRAGAAS